jgi:NAD(P)-dependent dehydrogenase (short-subunit alcohol dehydrogenase family)
MATTPTETSSTTESQPWRTGLQRPRMHGKVAFVTGGTRGIGAAITRSFAEQGAVVAAGYHRSGSEHTEKFLQQLHDNDVNATVHQGNVSSADDCRRTIGEVIEQHGRLDVLVNNAGITIDKTVLKMTDEDWYKVIGVNLSGAFFMSQAALPHMTERGSGRIINISSIIGQTGSIGQANYAASKSGLFGLTKSLAREACFQLQRAGKLSEESIGVTVNAVAPGFIETEMTTTLSEAVRDAAVAAIPKARMGTADEVAAAIAFLVMPESGYITGHVLHVDGGLAA